MTEPSPSRRPKRPLSCHDRALRLLAVRPRSRRELETRLRSAGFDPERVAEELARLEEVGLLDDERFAQEFAEAIEGTTRTVSRGGAGLLLRQLPAAEQVYLNWHTVPTVAAYAVRARVVRVERTEGGLYLIGAAFEEGPATEPAAPRGG